MKMVLHNADCMEIMRGYADGYFDLAVVDPPYGIAVMDKGEIGGGRVSPHGTYLPTTKFEKKTWDSAVPKKDYFDELFRVSKNQVIWGGNYFMQHIQRASPCWIVWDKNNGTTDFADCELAYTSFQTAVRKARFTWDGFRQGYGATGQKNAEREKRIHPTQKPVSLYFWLFEKYAQREFKVLDTHLGSGSSAVAARQFGVAEFVGCELEADYFATASARIAEAALQSRFEF